MTASTNGPRSRKGGSSAPSEELIARLGLPVDASLIERALTHRSYAYENGHLPTNERLEFLGDSVLGLVVTDTLYRTHSELPEGQLAKLRSAVVNSKALAEVARGLELGEFVKLGRGEEATGGRDKASILADTLEALIGSVYLDHGIEVAFDVVKRLFGPLIATSATLGAGLDWKTSLQELTAVAGIGVPDYKVSETGPDHDKFFEADACVAGVVYGHGSGRSKKEAEQQAAEEAWQAVRKTHAEALAAKGVGPGPEGDRKLTHGPYDVAKPSTDPAAADAAAATPAQEQTEPESPAS